MAIDTAAKRAAALGAGHPASVVLPVPDGTIDAADRAQLAGGYAPQAAAAVDRVIVEVNGGKIPLKTVSVNLYLEFDWTEAIPAGVTLVSVEHTVPGALVRESQAVDVAGTSDLDISGGVHGKLYQLTIVATLSDASTVTRTWPVRVFGA